MNVFKLILRTLFVTVFPVQMANATNVLAVLEIIPKADIDDISINEMRHLTDELRRQATITLPTNNYSVLTRDNIIALIPSDEKEAECLAESCAIDIGRAIGAEYVTQGSIGKFGKKLTISVELYESMSGKLLGSIVMESDDIEGLLNIIRQESKELFFKIKTSEPGFDRNLQNLQNGLISNAQKSKISTRVTVSLDILGAIALGVGVYQYFQRNKFFDAYTEMPSGMKTAEYDEAYQRVEDARVMRDIGFIAGGILIGSGLTIHFFF